LKTAALCFCSAAVALTVLLPAPGYAENNAQDAEPVVCVIFAEGHKTSGRFYGVAITTKTVGKLTLIEAQNDDFTQKVVLETQENMDNLMQMAQKDHIKFVKIPEKYSPELLEKARVACKPSAQ
jgi:hypothetical protein